MTLAQIGFVKALLVVITVSVLSFLGEANNLTAVLNPYTASLVAALAASLESYLKEKNGTAFFGAISVK